MTFSEEPKVCHMSNAACMHVYKRILLFIKLTLNKITLEIYSNVGTKDRPIAQINLSTFPVSEQYLGINILSVERIVGSYTTLHSI